MDLIASPEVPLMMKLKEIDNAKKALKLISDSNSNRIIDVTALKRLNHLTAELKMFLKVGGLYRIRH